MKHPDVLKGSKITVTKIADEYKISIPGYQFGLTLPGFGVIGFAALVLIILMNNASDTRSLVIYGLVMAFILIVLILMHSTTKIYFSKEYIKIRYGWFPFVRKRKTANLNRVFIAYENEDTGHSFDYLVFTFHKQWNIKIIVDHLSRPEREFLTGRLSYLRYKFYE